MQNLFDAPPPYQAQADSIYLPDMDLNAWPSSYYGRTRRIDLAKFYHDILKASSPKQADAFVHEQQPGDQRCSSGGSSSRSSSSSGSETSDDEESSNSLLQQFDQWDCIGDKLIAATATVIGAAATTGTTDATTGTTDATATATTAATGAITAIRPKKHVRFSSDAPIVFEYEPEYPLPLTNKDHSLFDDGWPGRTKTAMKSSGFIDFKSKIEAKLGAINDPSLISQLDTSNANIDESTLLYNQENSPLYRGYYRNRKSPLVQKLNLRPIPNEPNLMLDTSISPSNSYTDSPLTPKDGHHLPVLPMTESISAASSSSAYSNNTNRWLKTLSRIRNNSK